MLVWFVLFGIGYLFMFVFLLIVIREVLTLKKILLRILFSADRVGARVSKKLRSVELLVVASHSDIKNLLLK